ncbi:MAG: hypothetical protein ACM3WS_04020, partial [Bacillota bacterium]
MTIEQQDDVIDQPQDTEGQIDQRTQQDDEMPPGDAPQDDDSAAQVAGDDDEVVVSIGDEPPAPEEDDRAAPQWVRDLRKADREKTKRIRELEEQLKASQPQPQATEVGEEPTLEGCDYDEAKFKSEFIAWQQRKQKAEDERREREAAAKAEQEAWNSRLKVYADGKTELKVKDFDDVEAVAANVLSKTQQGIIVKGCKSPATMIYALGKNEKKLKELASIKDPVDFAFAIAKLEEKVNV